jgi:phthiocerol/phenolphthiocerol synthesis type-I polyketide synthase E
LVSEPESTPVEPIAIIGMSVKVPGANSVEEFWQNLAGGVESIRFFSREEQEAIGATADQLDDPAFVPAAATVDDVGFIDAGLFAMTPREAEIRDPQQRMFLELAHTALEDAGYDPARHDGEIGVYGGSGADDYQWKNVRRNPAVLASTGLFAIATSNHASYLSTFTSYKLNLRGPSLTVHTACSTSLVAIHLACEALRNAECEMALAGAVSIDLPQGLGYRYAEGGVMSPDGHCRAFDADALGTIWGSGGGVVVLKRLADAVADGDTIRAVVLGNAINNDGSDKVGFTAPSVAGQTAVISQALGVGMVDPRTVTYMEAHGTGTALGDPIEVAGLSTAFSVDCDDTQWCALGSVKTNVGHLSAAAGVVGLVKTVLALEHRAIPPSLHFRTPHPSIDFPSTPFYVNTELSTWDSVDGPRRAGVSSFGVGGTNAHLVLQEAPRPPGGVPGPARAELIRLSARTPTALGALTTRMAEHLRHQPEQDLGAVAFTLRQGRKLHQYRTFVVADNASRAARALADERVRTGQAAARPPRVAFLFSGQGSQHPGMGAGLYDEEPVYRAAVDQCAELLRPHLGRDVRDLLHAGAASGAADLLARTELTQPALFTVEYALARLWASWDVEPAAMVGHSVGEYVAATLAGVFALPDALRLVARRGALMQSVPAGAMVAVQLGEDEVRPNLAPELSIAAVNGPRTCVVSGPTEAIDAFAAALDEREVANRRLRTSHAFHSRMMDVILSAFHAEVAATPLREPDRPMLSNLTGGWVGAGQVTVPSYWVRHLREEVRFGDDLATLLAEGDWVLVEVGPGGQLAGLAAAHLAGSKALTSLPGPSALDGNRIGDRAVMLAAAGELWARGVEVDPGPWTGRRVPLPTYPYERKRFWVEPVGGADRPAGESAAQAVRRSVDDWFAVPTWRQLPPAVPTVPTVPAVPAVPTVPTVPTVPAVPAVPSEAADRVVVVGGGFAEALARRLRARGAEVRVIGPAEPIGAGPLPSRIVHAGALQRDASGTAWRPAAGKDPRAAWAAQDDGFFSVLALAQDLAAAQPEAPVRLDIVTAGTQAVLDNDVVFPEHATLVGPALVLPLELPWLTVRHVDMDARTDADADDVVAELLRPVPDGATTVALRGGRRWVRDWEQVRLPGGSAGLRDNAVCLITGGLGGIGITVAEELAVREHARLALLSRTPLPEEADWDRHLAIHGPTDRIGRAIAAIRRMRLAGAEVLVLAGDVTDVDDLVVVREKVLDRFGRLDVIVHAAGVAGGGMAEVKQRAEAEAVLAPKVRGTLALSRVFGDLPLDAVVLCASVTGIAGGFGQVDYCGANAFMDAVAQAGTAFSARIVSVDWGSWLEVGMAAEVAAPNAFRALQRGFVSTPMNHPVLSAAHRDPSSEAAWCTGTIGPRTHWVLADHRLAGRAVLPGTGYLTSVLAAAAAVYGDSRLAELRDVALMEPLIVDDDGQAEIRVAFAEGADDVDFQVTSRSAGTERTHARGTVAHVPAGPAPVHDLAAIRARCRVASLTRAQTFSHSTLFSFGPQWTSLRRVDVGVNEEIARLEAPETVAAEWDRWGGPHPAMFDEALSFAAAHMEGKFLPMGYGQVLVRTPLPAKFWSHLRYRDSGSTEIVVSDLTLLDDDGVELATITEFVLRRIDAEAIRANYALPATAATPAFSPTATDAVGIAPADGVDAIRRLLAADVGAQVAVTAVDLHATIAGARALTQRSVEEELTQPMTDGNGLERTVDTRYVPARTELERILCDLWQDALGVDQVGVDDDFFEAGGNSLVAVQLLGGIRKKTGQRVAMRSLFEASTVATMAAEIERIRTTAGDADELPITPLERS